MKRTLLILVFVLILLPVITAQIIIVKPNSNTITNVSALNVSHANTAGTADSWNTDLGVLTTPNATQFDGTGNELNLDESWLTTMGNTLWCALTGCTMSGDIDMGGNNIITNQINATYFNFTTDEWFDFENHNNLVFNESKLSSTYYNATQSVLIRGTLDDGTIVNTQHPDAIFDGVCINFSEESGSPALDLRVNFTGVESFNRGAMRYKTSSLSGDFPIRQLWSYGDEAWHNFPILPENDDGFVEVTQPVFDNADHIQDGIIQMRLYKASNGNTNNHYYIDWVAMVKGFGTPAGEEVDPYFETWLNNPVFNDAINVNGSGVNSSWDWGNFNYLNVSGTIIGNGTFAKYQFENNNFNGTGNITLGTNLTMGNGSINIYDGNNFRFDKNIILTSGQKFTTSPGGEGTFWFDGSAVKMDIGGADYHVFNTFDSAESIFLRSSGGTLATMIMQNTLGTATNSIFLDSDAGGVRIEAFKDIQLDAVNIDTNGSNIMGEGNWTTTGNISAYDIHVGNNIYMLNGKRIILGGDFIAQLGDNIGNKRLIVEDSDGIPRWSVDSTGQMFLQAGFELANGQSLGWGTGEVFKEKSNGTALFLTSTIANGNYFMDLIGGFLQIEDDIYVKGVGFFQNITTINITTTDLFVDGNTNVQNISLPNGINISVVGNSVLFHGNSTAGQITHFGIDFDDSRFRPTIFGGSTIDGVERIGFRGNFGADDNQKISFGNGADTILEYETELGANDFFHIGVLTGTSARSGNVVLNDKTTKPNDDYPIEANPTFRIQATTTDIDDYIKFNHDGSNANIFAGTGDLIINVIDGNALQVKNNSGWADVWAKDFIQKSQVFDTSLGSALDLFKDTNDYKTNGVLNKSLHYAYHEGETTDYSRPEYNQECFISNFTDETYGKEICVNKTIYPYTIISEGLDIGKQIATLEQGIYELKQENQMLKDALCTLDNKFEWCGPTL